MLQPKPSCHNSPHTEAKLKGRRHFRAATYRAQNNLVLQMVDPPFSPGRQRLSQISMSGESKVWFQLEEHGEVLRN
jgi:hypothetical protein